ncbi:hypothetical protein SCLCIDRAFT_986051 [Scleroderma citrinum Foug A]|uniref:Uncharacterized protein n=1 Tax=Scleroderma citrinum Foug A TaxID=1036808 RepID=A0A0C2ZCX3_9AGAM|nr:hypothetical protein SCLCIDRAFT_986051 [Scleroderma citrinum Foug A]
MHNNHPRTPCRLDGWLLPHIIDLQRGTGHQHHHRTDLIDDAMTTTTTISAMTSRPTINEDDAYVWPCCRGTSDDHLHPAEARRRPRPLTATLTPLSTL